MLTPKKNPFTISIFFFNIRSMFKWHYNIWSIFALCLFWNNCLLYFISNYWKDQGTVEINIETNPFLFSCLSYLITWALYQHCKMLFLVFTFYISVLCLMALLYLLGGTQSNTVCLYLILENTVWHNVPFSE